MVLRGRATEFHFELPLSHLGRVYLLPAASRSSVSVGHGGGGGGGRENGRPEGETLSTHARSAVGAGSTTLRPVYRRFGSIPAVGGFAAGSARCRGRNEPQRQQHFIPLCSARVDPGGRANRDITMDTTSGGATARPITVAYVNLFDATTVGRTVHLTPDEERRLRNVLAALRDYGFILEASFEPALPGCGFADVAAHLRATIGSPIADLALAATARSVPAVDPAPAAVMPVWPFEPDPGNEDVLLSSARLWGVDLLVEALRVEDDDDPTPVPSVRDRFRCWADAAGHGGKLKTTRLPGRDGCYVVFAAAAAA
jgi:hypothetical protein